MHVQSRAKGRNVKFVAPRNHELTRREFASKPDISISKEEATGEAEYVLAEPVTTSALAKPARFIGPFQIEYALAPALSLCKSTQPALSMVSAY